MLLFGDDTLLDTLLVLGSGQGIKEGMENAILLWTQSFTHRY